MANLISIIIGLLTFVSVGVAFIPLLGWLNWLILPGAVIGAIIGAFGEKKTGLIINVIVCVIGGVRLMIGGGII